MDTKFHSLGRINSFTCTTHTHENTRSQLIYHITYYSHWFDCMLCNFPIVDHHAWLQYDFTNYEANVCGGAGAGARSLARLLVHACIRVYMCGINSFRFQYNKYSSIL